MTVRLWRRFDEGELDARRAKGEGLPGGPPTVILSSLSGNKPSWLDALEFRRSFGGGMGLGDDMAGRLVVLVVVVVTMIGVGVH